MKKKLNKIICLTFFVAALAFISCEKVVNLNLKSADAKVVVQGNVLNAPGPYFVKLESSVSYNNDNTFPPVTGAQVTISDNAGNSELLTETGQGNYKTNATVGVPGRIYYLQVKANGSTYNALGAMANPLPIDSFLLRPTLSRLTQDTTGFRVTCKFTDPVGVGNYYKVVISSKDTAAIGKTTGRILSDKYTDGQQLSVSFRTNLIPRDSVTIQLQCITKGTFDFYNTLSNAVGSAGASQFLSSLPANPTNNISNGALGYFAVYAETKKTIAVP